MFVGVVVLPGFGRFRLVFSGLSWVCLCALELVVSGFGLLGVLRVLVAAWVFQFSGVDII